MDDLDAAAFAFVVGLINGVFAMFTGSILFGNIGLAFAAVGIGLLYRAMP
jgi:hypothetical protein